MPQQPRRRGPDIRAMILAAILVIAVLAPMAVGAFLHYHFATQPQPTPIIPGGLR